VARRTYAGETGDERRERRRAALMEAALDVVADGGWDRVTVRAVCTAARLNDRYFYESFADRDALLLATRDHVATGALRALQEAIEHTSPDKRIRAVVVAVIDFFTADPRRGRLMFESHPALHGRRSEMLRTLSRIVADQSTVILGDRAAAAKDRELGALTLVSGTMEVFAGWLRGEVDVTREHLADFLVAMVNTTGDLAAALARERG
jgi:AcrR family transcriptional regulator